MPCRPPRSCAPRPASGVTLSGFPPATTSHDPGVMIPAMGERGWFGFGWPAEYGGFDDRIGRKVRRSDRPHLALAHQVGKLGGENDVLAAPLQQFTKDRLRTGIGVGVGRVDEIDPSVDHPSTIARQSSILVLPVEPNDIVPRQKLRYLHARPTQVPHLHVVSFTLPAVRRSPRLRRCNRLRMCRTASRTHPTRILDSGMLNCTPIGWQASGAGESWANSLRCSIEGGPACTPRRSHLRRHDRHHLDQCRSASARA
jgi:hypothetical protein